MTSILLTGATGYIGQNLVRRLLNDGHNVSIIQRPTSNINVFGDVAEKLRIFCYNGDIGSLYGFVEAVQPEAVIHLATMFLAAHSPEQVPLLMESNLAFGTQILDAISNAGVKNFINVGTHWQNYNGDAYNPVNLYAATKQAFECIARYYLETSEMRMLTVKLIDTYGPFDPRPKIMSLFKRIAQSGELLEMSPGEQELGLLYIDDVVKGFMLALEYVCRMNPHEHHIRVLAPGEFYKLKEVARIFQEVSGVPLNIAWGRRSYRKREIMKVYKDGINILEQHQTIRLADGIKKMLDIERRR